LLVVALYAVQRGVAAREIDAVERHPDTGLERMCLNGVDWRLSESIAAEEVGVVAEDCHAGGDLECPGTTGLGIPQLRLERPAIVAEVEQLAVVVLSNGAET
jgi:hypothetical protein